MTKNNSQTSAKEKFKIVFDEATQILYKYYYGSITFDDIFSSWDYAITYNLIPKETKGFILDYRNATLENLLKEYWKISNYYKKHLDIFGGYKIAIIIERPKDAVIPDLVEQNDEGYLTHPFYSSKAAVKWILGES